MSLRKIKFGDKEIYKTKFYSSKQAISLDSVDLNKTVVSKKKKNGKLMIQRINIYVGI